MKKFKYIKAESLKEVTSLLKKYGKKARILAGGTDLLGTMKDNIMPDYPEIVINIKGIHGLDCIKEDAENLKIGTLTRIEDIAKDPLIKKKYLLLAEAAAKTASPHVRESATIGGNICQSNRCWYYWVPDNRFYCTRKGGKVCYALTGDNRYHSIFGAARINTTPCSADCPDHLDIPKYMAKIREGNISEAARIILQNNPIPAITGRVCPHFCQSDCNRGKFDETVSIRSVERFIGDYALRNSKQLYKVPDKNTGKSVAVIGAGPAGLTAAYFLRQTGHSVTVFDRMIKPGGLLTYGIPPYRLPKEIVQKQIKAIESTDINLKSGFEVNQDKLAGILRDYDAVLLALGVSKEKKLCIRGERLFISGSEFLSNLNTGNKRFVSGKTAVIGGGNAAVDIARSLLRMKAEPLILYRRTRNEMPALIEEIDKAVEEGVNFEFLVQPVDAKKKGSKILLKCVKMKLGAEDESGRPQPEPVKGSEFSLKVDAVISATGEEPDYSIIPNKLLNKKGGFLSGTTSLRLGENLFLAGDFVNGPSNVVASIGSGRRAAEEIDTFLQQVQNQNRHINQDIIPLRFNSSYLKKTCQVSAPALPVTDRLTDINLEETKSIVSGAAAQEANRCFNCGCVAVNSSDIAPALIAVSADIRTTKRTVQAEQFFTAGVDTQTVLDDDEVVIGIEIPKLSIGSKTVFIKFALRKSIDFPVVNCAAVINSENGKVKSSRICLNSVYTQPWRAVEAEKYITGENITETIAERAADAGIFQAFPLINNSYKIQVARTLIKRAILACRG